MGAVNLGIGRIVVIVALVVAGIALLANGFSTNVSQTAASPTVSPHHHHTASPTPTGSTEIPPNLPSPQAPADVTFAVFNGTSAAGLAAQADQTLTNAGYVSGQAPANSPVPGVSKTTIYYRGGTDSAQNQADAQQIADTLFKGAKVALLGPDFSTSVGKSVQVVVVLGQDYAASTGA